MNPETGRPSTMTYSALRGASIMYTAYLRNMRVTAAVTMSLRHGDVLWGLIAAHHYSGTAHLSLPVRAECEFHARIVSMQHQLLEDAALQGVDQQQKLGRLMRLTLRMDSLLDSFLHFSRVSRMALHMEIVDLNSVFAEAIEIVDARRSERPNEIVVPRLLPSATCDRIRVREIMTNPLSNARQYNDRPVCRIEVGFVDGRDDGQSAHRPANACGLPAYFMRDNGIGIEPRHADQVFKMFRRLYGRDEYGGGTGAGLTIVKRLVQRHGGEIWIDSIPGEGANPGAGDRAVTCR